MSKFNLTKLSTNHGFVKTAAIIHKFLRDLRDPASGKLYTELNAKLPDETPEARGTRTAIYKSILEGILNNKNLNSTLTSLEGKIGAKVYNSVNDFYKDVFQIIESELFPLLLKASEKTKVSPADNAQNKTQVKEWIDGIRDAYQGAHATADFLYLFIKDMIKFVSDKEQFVFSGGYEFDPAKFERQFMESNDNKNFRFSFFKWKTYGVKNVAEQAAEGANSQKECGIRQCSSPGWYFLWGRKSSFSSCADENAKTLKTHSANGWCTQTFAADTYINKTEKFYLYFDANDQQIAKVAIVLEPGGYISEMQKMGNNAPSEYLSQIKDLMDKDGLKTSVGVFGTKSGWKVNQVMEWYDSNKSMNDETFVNYMMAYLPKISPVVNKYDNIIDLAIALGEESSAIELEKGFDMGTQLALGFAGEKMQKQEVRRMILEKLIAKPSVQKNDSTKENPSVQKNDSTKENPHLQGNESTKEIIKLVFFYKLGEMSLSNSSTTVVSNLKSLLTTKSLPEDQEELMFRDDEKSTLQEIVKNMVYR